MAQVGYNGGPGYNSPFVDDGSVGFKGDPTGCIEYPNFGSPGVFGDSPGPGVVIGAVEFITCKMCVAPCICEQHSRKQSHSTPGRRIVKVGSCKKWSLGFKGSLDNAPDATPQEMKIWTDAINKKTPSPLNGGCYTCNGSQPLN